MKLSIIVPAHNEEENISDCLKEIEEQVKADFEIVVVNDHSTDSTPSKVKESAAKFGNIRLVENKMDGCFANALKTGFSNANGEFILPIMADLCDDLSCVGEMIQKLEAGADIVCGSRYMPGGKRLGGSKFKAFLSAWAGRSLYYLLGIPTHDIANAFKMYRKKVIDSMNLEAKGFEISMEIPIKAFYLGFKITEVPTIWKERTRGKSSFKVFKLLPNYLKFYFWAVFKRLKR